jgi:sulfur carrier protein ThiS
MSLVNVTINTFTATAPAQIVNIDTPVTPADLLVKVVTDRAINPDLFEVTINGAEADMYDDTVVHADVVVFNQVEEEQIEEEQSMVGQETALSGDTINVLFVTNMDGGFARPIAAIKGITISQFVAQQGGASGGLVRVNSQIVTADYILNEGDKVSVTPTKIAGAADNNALIEVLFVSNANGGFANKVTAIAGVTAGQFIAQQNSGMTTGFSIRINNLPATADQVLNNNDKVSVSPVNIKGA